jgi:hypothetical protein
MKGEPWTRSRQSDRITPIDDQVGADIDVPPPPPRHGPACPGHLSPHVLEWMPRFTRTHRAVTRKAALRKSQPRLVSG